MTLSQSLFHRLFGFQYVVLNFYNLYRVVRAKKMGPCWYAKNPSYDGYIKLLSNGKTSEPNTTWEILTADTIDAWRGKTVWLPKEEEKHEHL